MEISWWEIPTSLYCRNKSVGAGHLHQGQIDLTVGSCGFFRALWPCSEGCSSWRFASLCGRHLQSHKPTTTIRPPPWKPSRIQRSNSLYLYHIHPLKISLNLLANEWGINTWQRLKLKHCSSPYQLSFPFLYHKNPWGVLVTEHTCHKRFRLYSTLPSASILYVS